MDENEKKDAIKDLARDQEIIDGIEELATSKKLNGKQSRTLRCAKRRVRGVLRSYPDLKKNTPEEQEVIDSLPPLVVPDRTLKISVLIHCYNYQHRLCWMLSSILQQEGYVPEISINISHGENNGDPTTESVCNFFREEGLDITQTIVDQDNVRNRSHSRETQIKNLDSDWVVFADCDMVYDPLFFDDMQKQLKSNLSQERKAIGADRHSMEIEYCQDFFNKDTRVYPMVIPDVASIVSEWPLW